MIKDFSKQKEDQIVSIINKIVPTENDKYSSYGIKIIGDRISDMVGPSVQNTIEELDGYEKPLVDKKYTYISTVNRIFETVRQDDLQYSNYIGRQVKDDLAKPLITYLKELKKMVNPKAGSIAFDKSKCNQLAMPLLKHMLVNNLKNNYRYIVYIDDRKHYGGYQGACRDTWNNPNASKERKNEIKRIILNHYPGMSDKKIGKLLKEMSNEGCGYTALANTIFSKYIGNEAEFEKKFGFPMYDKNGYPNYDLVMLDLYCSEGEFNGIKYGTTRQTREKKWEHYLTKKGIDVDVVNIKLSIDNFDEVSKNGEIIVSTSPLRLRDDTGRLVDDRDGGHATTITDVVTINGKKMYKVSSWGESYYIDPTDFDKSMRIEYQQIRY